MSTTPSPPPDAQHRKRGMSRHAWLLIAAAFGIGLLLFAVVLLNRDDKDDFFRADGSGPVDRAGQVFEPLPAPDAADAVDAAQGSSPVPRDGAPPSVAAQEAGNVASTPDLAESLPAPPPPPPSTAPANQAATVNRSARPIHSPQPDYPARAMRNGESGEVMVQVEIDAGGRPTRVDVVQSSRSRDLDRAAVRAVQRWQFSPAIRNGQPVSSRVLVPIQFDRRS